MKINGFISTVMLIGLLLIATPEGITYAENEEAWMPDPHLRQAVRERLAIPDGIPMLPEDMTGLYDFVMEHDIESLRGLEHAINLEFLHIGPSDVSDLTPLAGFENLRGLKLFGNRISDITPLAGLINLEILELQDNQIVDISPLKGLVNLTELNLGENPILDFTPIYGLAGIETLRLGDIPIDPEALQILNPVDRVVCDVAGEPILPRIENREYPSFFGAWHNIINLPTLSWEERLAFHDLYFCCPMFGLSWVSTPDDIKIRGHIEGAKIERDAIRARNPNILFLVGITHYSAASGEYPDDAPYWLRDATGNRVEHLHWGGFWLDFTHPDMIDLTVQRALAVAKCGLYDGVFFDHWNDAPRLAPYRTLEAEREAKDTILKRIRAEVSDDFLILVNTNRAKIPRWAEYVNGTFMETVRDYGGGYTYKSLFDIESTLLWSEEHLREPQINGLEGWGIESEPLDSPRNKQWMRVFTTMSLTHSDGYVQFVTSIEGIDHQHQYEIWPGHPDEHVRGTVHDHQHEHYWYDFWDASLGQPVGGDETKGQLYENREGLFIREFTNGWAVYNRSGKEQQVEFSEAVSGVASGVEDKRSHTLPDLDGEIYLKAVAQVIPGKYPPLYWINAKANTLQRLVDAEVKNLVSEAQNATSLTVDTVNGKLYWTEKTGNRTGKIQRANLDGTNIQLVKDLTSAPLDITLDIANGKLYLSNAWGKIQRMNLDGSNFQSNLITGLQDPQNLVLDSMDSKLYWTEQTSKTTGKIQRANLDGNPNVQLVKALTSAPRGMTLDAVNRKLYLTNGWGKLQRMNLNGSNFESNLITGLASPGQVAVDRVDGKVYWTEMGKLRRADLNGENIQDVVTGLGELTDLGLGIDSVGEIGVAAAPAIRTTVEQTQLLANYPNPFNPETWIPYHLANPSDVRITIYDARGTVIRHLDLGHQREGYYTRQSRAAYWDGRNAVGERVASGVYFYQLQADNVSLLRKMIIVK